MQLNYTGQPSSWPIVRGYRTRIRNKAKGRGHLVLQKLGVPERVLTGERVQCPTCVGELQFIDADRRGSFFCHGSGRADSAGDGFVLVAHVGLLDYVQAVRVVGQALNLPELLPRRVQRSDR
ncbi:MAG: hypothetical protein WCB10_15055 [Steroidobacteraceae bacterium]